LELENVELYERLSAVFDESLNEENVISRLKILDSIGGSCEREIEFVASHLMDINGSSIFELNTSLLSRLFSHSSLRLRSEDWLYEHIMEHILRDHESCSLLEFVGYEYLSKSLNHFLILFQNHLSA
jgi:hypothetical protein